MAVYTDITDTELEEFLADYDLGRPLSFKGIAEGVENSNFLLETGSGRHILTVYERRVRPGDLPFFLGLMTHLAERRFPSATPIADRAGRTLKAIRGRPAAVVAFLPGLSVRRPGVAHCREAGEGLAWLHAAAEGFEGHRDNDLGQGAWAAMFAGREAAAEALKPGLAAAIRSDLALIADRWPRGLPGGVVHADFFPDNVFFVEGRFAGAIDFYFAARDHLAYDIGVALNAWCFEPDGGFNVTAARAFVQGYERRRPLTAPERAALPILAHGAAMRFFLTRLADWGPAPAGALVRPKDPLEYERRLAVHRAGVGLFEAGG
ncbi:MAG TPA: homoserine kinase [Caulobacteraceae bacterium]|nr:homoserine kinase [Caulobacteraceae bacterium]